MTTPAVVLSDLSLAYDRHTAVHGLSGSFATGSLTAIVGPNGAGKSTLAKALVGLLRPARGHISLGTLSAQAIGYLPQAAEIDRGFPLTVADLVAMGAWRTSGALRRHCRAQAQQVTDCLATVGLAGFEPRSLVALSSGQLQRVLFARLLLQDAPLIVLDEPFNAMDARTTEDLLHLVHRWHHQGRTVIAVLHDLEQVRQHFPSTLLMAGRLVAWGPTSSVLVTDHLRQARDLAAASADNGPRVYCPAGVAP